MKTRMGQVKDVYVAMVRSFEEFERASIVGNPTFEQPILDLVQRVITAVDELLPIIHSDRKKKRLLYWKDDAEALHWHYSPFPPVQYDPETLERNRQAILYSMGATL